jgi:hypothetical protein
VPAAVSQWKHLKMRLTLRITNCATTRLLSNATRTFYPQHVRCKLLTVHAPRERCDLMSGLGSSADLWSAAAAAAKHSTAPGQRRPACTSVARAARDVAAAVKCGPRNSTRPRAKIACAVNEPCVAHGAAVTVTDQNIIIALVACKVLHRCPE